ncbi:hypothetical protein [Paenibacillus sp. GCM10027626]|uniref:hypothetical protein n=1 Tax=Paenibacillus sp. GCM10027626 TaxID=3273411 RepID=UPI00362A203A
MKANSSAALEQVMLAGKLADLKEDHYRIVLAFSALTELLIEKGLVTQDELERKTGLLDSELEAIISASLHPMA